MIEGCLGQGGFGVVYLARDLERNGQVAIKALSPTTPEGVARAKREFRALQDLSHPNLVHMFELFEHQGRWFLVMEHVAGQDLLAHTRPGGVLDETRLRDSLVQLAGVLNALHEAAIVHRDIKPENIRVDANGRAVLIDFGLVDDAPDTDADGLFLGTAGYAAPEQMMGQPVGPPADWYALGVVLHEALTAERPFTTTDLEQLARLKQRGLVSTPIDTHPDVPPDLSHLCTQLLSPRPGSRPLGMEVLASLDAEQRRDGEQGMGLAIPEFQTGHGGPARFVGRDRELEALQDALASSREGKLTFVYLEGESGVGKTALVQRFSEQLEGQDILVLASRCHERETVPYNALDGAIERLAHHLDASEPRALAALLPEQAELLLHLFPVLGHLEALRDRWTDALAPADPVRLRAAAFGALRELLRNLAAQLPVVITIDDAQWADAESLALIDAVMRGPNPPPVLFVVSARDLGDAAENVTEAAERWQQAAGAFVHRTLDRLSFEAARSLALRLLKPRDRGRADTVAQESGGHPLFIEALVRYGQASGDGVERLDDALAYFIGKLDGDSRALLQVVALAGTPLSQRTAQEAAGLPAEATPTALAKLRVARLLRVRRTADVDAVAVFHDRVGKAAIGTLSAEQRRRLHGRLATVLGTDRRTDLEVLGNHFQQAGQPDRAAEVALRAAKRAADSLAFARAARLYGWALELYPDMERAHSVRVRRADALGSANRSAEAADAYLQAMEGAGEVEALTLERRAAEHLLRSDRMDEGIEVSRRLLARLGTPYPNSPREAVSQLAWLWLKRKVRGTQFRQRSVEEIPPYDLARIDALYAVASSLGSFRHLEAAAIQARHLLLALEAGEPGRVALALCADSFGAYFMGARERVVPQLQRARELAERSEDPAIRGLQIATEGALRWMLDMDMQAMARCMAEAEIVLMEQCTGVGWLLDQTRWMLLVSSAECGDPGPLLSRYPQLLDELGQRSDAYAQSELLLWAGTRYHLMRDDPAGVRASLAQSRSLWERPRGTFVDEYVRILRFRLDRYEGRDSGARQYIDAWPALRRSGLLRLPHVAMGAHTARARALLDLAHADDAGRARHVKAAFKDLERARACGYELPQFDLLTAEAHWLQQREQRALAVLQRVNTECSMQLPRQQARYLRGRIERGGVDNPPCRTVEDELQQSGIRQPAAYLRAFGGF